MRTAGDGGAYRETLQAKSGLDASWSHSEGGQQDTADGSSNRPQPRQLERRHERSRTISAARPSLLAIASGSATSSTSIATIPRLQRSTSDWSIAARNSNLSSNTRKDSDNTTNSLADSQRPSQDPASSPVSRTTHAFAAYDPRSPREDSNEHNGQPSRNPIDVYDDNSEVFEAVAASSSRSLRRDDRSTLSTSLVDPDDLDGIPSDKEEMVSWPLQGPDLDPRKLLRDQLRRSDSVRSRSFRSRPRTDSARSIQSLSSTDSRTADMLTESRSTPTSGPEEILQPTPQSPPKIQKQPVQLHDRPSLPSRRYFVLTSAGKPVFASRPNWRVRRKGRREMGSAEDVKAEDLQHLAAQDEEDPEELLTSLVGVMQAIISLYAVEDDMIRYIDAGDLKIAFYLKAPMYLVAVSSLDEPESLLRVHLEYLHLAIISITTQSSITNIFKERSNFDLRRLLAGTENILNGLLDDLQEGSPGGDFAFQVVSGALKVVPFLPGSSASDHARETAVGAKTIETLRDDCTKALRPPKKYEGILYALLVSHSTLITLLRPKNHSIHPADLHILLSTINSTDALRTPNSESWIPICMPRFNSRGFLHAFISYCDSEAGTTVKKPGASRAEEAGSKVDLGLGIILITADKEGFFDMKQWKDHIVSMLFREQASSNVFLGSDISSSLYRRLRLAVLPTQADKADTEAGNATSPKKGALRHDLSLAAFNISMPHILPTRHFWYKSKTHVQIFSSSSHMSEAMREASSVDASELKLPSAGHYALRYLQIREALHNSVNRARGDGPAKLVYSVHVDEAILGLSTSTYELYACYPPAVLKSVAAEAAQALARWVRKNENRIFLVNSASF